MFNYDWSLYVKCSKRLYIFIWYTRMTGNGLGITPIILTCLVCTYPKNYCMFENVYTCPVLGVKVRNSKEQNYQTPPPMFVIGPYKFKKIVWKKQGQNIRKNNDQELKIFCQYLKQIWAKRRKGRLNQLQPVQWKVQGEIQRFK